MGQDRSYLYSSSVDTFVCMAGTTVDAMIHSLKACSGKVVGNGGT